MKQVQQFLLMIAIPFVLGNNVFAHEWMAPREAAALKNPIRLAAESINRGKLLFTKNCASCHGVDIEGMDKQELGLEKNTPNLKKRLRNHSDGDFKWKIENGRGDMPGFKNHLAEKEIWHVINYIRSESR